MRSDDANHRPGISEPGMKPRPVKKDKRRMQKRQQGRWGRRQPSGDNVDDRFGHGPFRL